MQSEVEVLKSLLEGAPQGTDGRRIFSKAMRAEVVAFAERWRSAGGSIAALPIRVCRSSDLSREHHEVCEGESANSDPGGEDGGESLRLRFWLRGVFDDEHLACTLGRARIASTQPVPEIRLIDLQCFSHKLRTWALEQHGLPRSGLRKASDYMLRYWAGLTAFLDDPLLDIHNNRTERALRGVVLGRKNHYGSRSEAGTQAAAILYSLVESAKLAEVDPSLYLMLAVKRAIEKPGAVLLPHQLAAALP